jgi:hypothetical protein
MKKVKPENTSDDPRRSARVVLDVEVVLKRRVGKDAFRVSVQDLSQHGCKLELVDPPAVEEHVWVRIEGLEPLQARICWVEGFTLGVEFQKDLHPAVFDHLVSKLR